MAVNQVKAFEKEVEYWRHKLKYDARLKYTEVAYEELLLPQRRDNILRATQAFLSNSAGSVTMDMPEEYESSLFQIHNPRCQDRFKNYKTIMESLKSAGSRTYHVCKMLDEVFA